MPHSRVAAEQEPGDAAEHAGDQQRCSPDDGRMLEAVLHRSLVVAERGVLRLEQQGHQRRAQQARGLPDTGDRYLSSGLPPVG